MSAEGNDMQVTARWQALLLWLAIGCIAALSCSLIRPAAHIGSEYFPMGNDSFYHAARILEAVHDPAAFYEFDPKIHAPEGSLLVWPWGYDYLIAKVVRAGVAVGLSADPLTIMLWIPVAAVFIGLGLLMLVARRLGLNNWTVALAGLCMALSQTTQVIYGFGQIDHHYAEHIFMLASLLAGLAWFRTQSVPASIALGAVFGIALAAHNALFILQLPFLATMLAFWLQGKTFPMRSVVAFVAALLGSALMVLMPSQPFQEGRFEFYTLSWFHLYIACCTSLVVLFMARLQFSRRSLAWLIAMAAVLVIPLLGQIKHGEAFVSGSLGILPDVIEMRSPVKLAFDGEVAIVGFYSLLICLAPITLVLCALRIWRERQRARLLFWIWCVFGLALLSTQLRMHYFGTMALSVPWLIVAQEYALKRPELSKRSLLIASLLLVLAYVPVIRHALVAPAPRAGDQWFDHLYPVIGALRTACAEDPGVVLADNNAGHYIRYFTDCSVIANNFLLTEQQFSKVAQVRRLFSLPPDELLKQAPWIKYVLARPDNIEQKPNGHYSYTFSGDAVRLPEELLLQTQPNLPPEFKLLFQSAIQVRGDTVQNVPYARLYKIAPANVSATATSANHVNE